MRWHETGSVHEDVQFKKRRVENTGLRNHPMYDVWDCMIHRCTDPTDVEYRNYGARGVKVCERWMDLRNFIADMAPRPDRHSIDRINNNGNYDPSNCRWATAEEQGNNTRVNRLLSFGDETLTVTQWAKRVGIGSDTISRRLKNYGWSIEEALTIPVRKILSGPRQSRQP
jgi:hypothetical protein